MSFTAKIGPSGGLEFSSADRARAFHQWKMARVGKEIEIDDKKYERSSGQNRFYWAYLTVIAKETGENEHDLHEFFRRKLLPPVFKTVQGEEVKFPRSTTDLDKADFSDYLDKISALCGVPLPNPEDAGYIPNY